jgi:hypothetical protein
MSKLENILLECCNSVLDLPKTNDPIGKPIDEALSSIKQHILGMGWYYYDPDELGEDAFKSLGDDEMSEL